jgi:3-oxoacyl-[acyl-carrier protein] reductase
MGDVGSDAGLTPVGLGFENQVVVVTGASTGIGAAIARGFAVAGATVVVHYNASSEAASRVAEQIAAAGGRAETVRADVTRPVELQGLFDTVLDRHGRIDVLVNNAGGLVERVSLDEATDGTYGAIMDLNVRSVFQACRAVLPGMRERGSGAIVNVASIAARNGGAGGSVLYAASKAAVATMTRGLAREVAPDGIRVNALSPGVIDTPFHERHTDPEVYAALEASVPLGRAGRAHECVGPALFLASDTAASYVTGQILEVNGGQVSP